MDMATYCQDKGMTYEGYLDYQDSINKEADEIISIAHQLHPKVDGELHPTTEIIKYPLEDYDALFLIQALKKSGKMEFYYNNAEYRVV